MTFWLGLGFAIGVVVGAIVLAILILRELWRSL
jgi:hypothetical protein